MKQVSTFIDKHWYILSMLLILAYTIFSGIQTICYSDEGYFGSAYQNFFDAHESTYTTDSYYLSILVGAIWDKVFGNYGILSYTILVGFISCITFHFVQRTLLKDGRRNRWYVTVGFFLTLLYGFTYLFNNIHLTCLLLSIEGCLIVESYNERSPHKFLGASFLGVLNVFSRIPNVLLLLLLLIPIIAARKDKRLIVSYIINAIVGGMFALFVMFVLMQLLGHWVYFYKATFENLAIEAASGEASIHSLSTLMIHYVMDYICVFILMIVIGVFEISRKLFRRSFSILFYLITASLLMIITIYLLKIYVYVHSFNYIVFSVGTYCLLHNILLKRGGHFYTLYLVALGIAFLLPIGTDAGIASLGGFSSMFMMPLALSDIGNAIRTQNCIYRKANNLIVNSLVALFIILRLLDMMINGTWAEPGTRMVKTYTIENSKFATVFVSKERSKEIDPALEELSKYVKEGDYLFCFKDIPIFNYLTRTKPYAYCSEAGFINPGLFNSHIEQAEAEIDTMPIVIREKGIIKNPGWNRQLEIFENFISRHKYNVVWESEKFEILVPGNYDYNGKANNY